MYLRESWGKLPAVLSREGLILFSGARATARNLVKQRLKGFNEVFDEMYGKQSNWVIADKDLRERTCQVVTQTIVPVDYLHSAANKMGDTACLMHGSSYAAVIIPNEFIQSQNHVLQGNAKHALGESISFGRFMTDQSLSWDKWSTFPHKKYVEEAERYAQPGSVAQKKAFFEAHYKKIAAQKAAALLEQQNAAKTESEPVADVDAKTELVKTQDSKQVDVTSVNELNSSTNPLVNIENNVTRSTKKSGLGSPNKKRASSKSLLALMNLIPINKEPDRDPISAIRKSESSPKDSSTPFKNPVAASIKSVSSYTEPNTDQSENRRIKTPPDSAATPGRKNRPKWHILSAMLSCSKSLGTEGERAAKRKQARHFLMTQGSTCLQVKAGNGFRKLSCSFCSKPQPMIDPCKDGAIPRNQIKKAPAIQPRSTELERSNSNKMHGSNLGAGLHLHLQHAQSIIAFPRIYPKNNVFNQIFITWCCIALLILQMNRNYQ
ncbi:hypothetical protein PHJA_000640700 [Phtheirospermum japonicum]|uniref:Exocyst complex subunit Exo70 C-terminal domain-containing protein n=1 Tax=Phtheirospermum japonicum TaxID=374723 RepID=A0A830BHU4_9LAMI|nr:hypothetical protein PHJA_000640700 [Phtheirospermum japonicum]